MTSPSTVGNVVARAAGTTLVALEAVALIACALAYAWHGIAGSDDPALTWSLVAMLAVLAAPLVLAAVAIARGRRWGRSYGIMWQVLQVAGGWYLLDVSRIGGVVTMAVALAAGAALVIDTRRDPQI